MSPLRTGIWARTPPTKAIDRVESPASLLPLGEARRQLVDRVLNTPKGVSI